MQGFVIADRRDLLGGRLIPILNAMRLAHHLNAKFLMTWHTDSSDFQSYVSGASEIFGSDFIAPYDPDSGQGNVIAINDPVLASAIEPSAKLLDTPERDTAGIADFFVSPNVERGTSYKLERRLSIYRLSETETFSQAAWALAEKFDAIPKTDAIRRGFEAIDRMSVSRLAAVHIRRLHLLSDTALQINRFDSFCSTSHIEGLTAHLISDGYERIAVASDNDLVLRRLKSLFPQKVILLSDILDLGAYTAIQRALLDMYFMSKASDVFGPISAFGVVAAIIGKGKFRNILREIAIRGITGRDETGAVDLQRAETAGDNRSPGAEKIDALVDWSAYLCRRAASLGGEDGLCTALMGLVMRATQYRHPNFFADWPHFIVCAKNRAAQHPAILARLLAIEAALVSRKPTELRIPEELRQTNTAQPTEILLAIAESAVAGDTAFATGTLPLAIEYFQLAEEMATRVDLGLRGIALRMAQAYAAMGNPDAQIATLRRAVVIAPDYGDAHFTLAEALRTISPDESRYHYERATSLEECSSSFWLARGKFLASIGNDKEATECIEMGAACG